MNSYGLDAQQVAKLLIESAETQALVVLTWRNKVGWRVGKTRLASADSDARRFAAELPITTDDTTIALLPLGLNLGVSLRSGHKKYVFASTVLACDGAGVQLAWPQQVQQMQRRCYQRVAWFADQPLDVQFWAGGLEHPPTDGEPGTWTAQLLDLSAGGMQILWPSDQAFPLPIGSLVGCRFAPEPNRSPLTLEGICRHVESTPDGRMAAGFQFIGLECSEAGRARLRHLARVVGRLQREHIHRQATDLSYRLRHL